MRNYAKIIAGDKSYICEDNGDGTYTHWHYSVWGAIGDTGEPLPGVRVEPIKTKADHKEANRIEAMIERATRTQTALYIGMGGKL